jgi:hypothetical protein
MGKLNQGRSPYRDPLRLKALLENWLTARLKASPDTNLWLLILGCLRRG